MKQFFPLVALGFVACVPAQAQINMNQPSAVGRIAQQATGMTQYNTPPVATQNYGYGYYPNYGAPAYGYNYGYPQPIYSAPIAPPPLPWARSAWITGPFSSPPLPVYNNCPPSYQYYSYPVPTYGAYGNYPAYGAPVYVYPGYGNGTYTTQSGGYGIRAGNGNLSVSVGGSQTTTTTRTY